MCCINLLVSLSVRLCNPGRRHMQITLSHLGTPQCYIKSMTRRSRSQYLQDPYFSRGSCKLQLPEGALTFLNWFSSLDKGQYYIMHIVYTVTMYVLVILDCGFNVSVLEIWDCGFNVSVLEIWDCGFNVSVLEI